MTISDQTAGYDARLVEAILDNQGARFGVSPQSTYRTHRPFPNLPNGLNRPNRVLFLNHQSSTTNQERSTMIVISIENISKYCRLGSIGNRTLYEDLNRWWAKVRGKPDPTLRIDQLPPPKEQQATKNDEPRTKNDDGWASVAGTAPARALLKNQERVSAAG